MYIFMGSPSCRVEDRLQGNKSGSRKNIWKTALFWEREGGGWNLSDEKESHDGNCEGKTSWICWRIMRWWVEEKNSQGWLQSLGLDLDLEEWNFLFLRRGKSSALGMFSLNRPPWSKWKDQVSRANLEPHGCELQGPFKPGSFHLICTTVLNGWICPWGTVDIEGWLSIIPGFFDSRKGPCL